MFEMMASYIEDLRSNLLLLNDSLIRIQNGQRDQDVINGVFRVAHTIKGNSAAMEFTKIEKVMHTMEDVLQDVRSGKRELTASIIDVLFSSHDFLEDCLEILGRDNSDSSLDISGILAKIVKVAEGDMPQEVHPAVQAAEVVEKLDFPFSIDVESTVWKRLVEDGSQNMTACWIKITLDERCQMKAVRTWLVFNRLSQFGEIISSVPECPEDEFKDGDFEYEGFQIEVLLNCDRDVDELVDELRSTIDVAEVSKTEMTFDDLFQYAENESLERAAQRMLREAGIVLLDHEQYGGDETILDSLQSMLSRVANMELKGISQVFFAAIDGAMTILQEMKANLQVPVSDDLVILSYILKLLEEGLERPEYTYQPAFMEELEEKLTELRHERQALGDILQKRGVLSESDIDEILEKKKTQYQDLRFGAVAVMEQKASPYDVISALQGQKSTPPQPMDQLVKADTPRPGGAPAAAAKSAAENVFIRVPVGKVEGLMDMLGELLILNSQSEQLAGISANTQMLSVLSQTAKLIREIQSLSMSLRLIEIKPTLHRLTRIARDTASELNKQVSIIIEGDETEIDRSAAEKLFDPLMHLVRNAVSHGIEDTPEERTRLGKRAEGRVTIRAYNSRGNVYIEVCDDGKGIDPEKIMAKAKKMGLVDENVEYTNDEILRFIFLPGFSTQEQINSISGRGVGMNVVEEEMKHLGGKVEVESKMGQGTVFTLRIPMNLAVVNGTVVEIKGERFIIPTLFIKEFAMKESYRWVSIQGRNRAIQLRNEGVIPILEPSQVFGYGYDTEDGQSRNELVIMEMESKHLAFPVDKILARQEIVSKALDSEFAQIGFATGASILGDGKVSLILDVEAMFKIAGM